MTLTPLAPMQGPQAQQPGQLPDVPAPMQPAQAPAAVQTAQPWHSDVVANFQQAHAMFDPMSYGLASGVIGVSPVNPVMPSRGYGSGLLVIPGDGEDTGSGGGNWQPGPNSTPYNQGVDQGPQTDSPGPAADTQPLPATISDAQPLNPAPMQPAGSPPYSVGPNDPSGLQPFTNQGTDPSGNPVPVAPQPYNYATPGSEVPIIDTSVPGASFGGDGGGD